MNQRELILREILNECKDINTPFCSFDSIIRIGDHIHLLNSKTKKKIIIDVDNFFRTCNNINITDKGVTLECFFVE